MFKNPFSLHLYRINKKEEEHGIYTKINSKDDLLFKDKDIEKRILPSFQVNNNSYIIGDLFFNKKTKEFIVLSFLTYSSFNSKGAINKLGFFVFKNHKSIEKTVNILENIEKSKLLKFNEINLDEFTFFGNIFLDKNNYIFLFKFYNNNSLNLESLNSSLNTLRTYLNVINNISILICVDSDGLSSEKYLSYKINKINLDSFLEMTGEWTLRLCYTLPDSVKSVDSEKRQIIASQHNIYELRKEHKGETQNNAFMLHFDLTLFETTLLISSEEKDIDYQYIFNASSRKYKEVRFKDKEYTKSLLYFL